MVAIHLFRALRYNPALVGDLGAVIAPPYDVIDPEEQEQLYRVSPYNVIRLTLSKQFPNDTVDDNRYTRTARDFAAWRASRTLQRDATPALYLIQHTFTDGEASCSRLGFIALLELNDATPRDVYRHEATLAAPKADRTKLLQAVQANLEPIFCVYPDDSGKIQSVLQHITASQAPTACATFKGEDIQLWAVTESALIESITRHLAATAVLIADGHHRFEVSYNQRARHPFLMSYFASMADPALVVRPIHRVIAHQNALNRETLRRLCAVEPLSDLSSALRWLGQETDKGRFSLYDKGVFYRVEIRQEALARWLMAPTVPLPVATLDVSILHGLILPQMGVNGTGVQYLADPAKALALAQQSDTSVWLLRGIPLPQVYALAAQGMTLAPKSTYFYPKVPSGLVINPFDETG